MLFLGILVACNNVQTKTSEISISPIPEIKKEIFHDPDSAVISKKAIELDNKFSLISNVPSPQICANEL